MNYITTEIAATRARIFKTSVTGILKKQQPVRRRKLTSWENVWTKVDLWGQIGRVCRIG